MPNYCYDVGKCFTVYAWCTVYLSCWNTFHKNPSKIFQGRNREYDGNDNIFKL